MPIYCTQVEEHESPLIHMYVHVIYILFYFIHNYVSYWYRPPFFFFFCFPCTIINELLYASGWARQNDGANNKMHFIYNIKKKREEGKLNYQKQQKKYAYYK